MALLVPGTLLSAARQVEYDPSRNWLRFDVFGADSQWPAPSAEALSLLYQLYEPLSLVSPLATQRPWDSATLDEYQQLSPAARAEILVFETLLLHELTHRVDYTHSVQGAAFRTLTVRQAATLLRLWPTLVRSGVAVQGVVSKWDPGDVTRAGPDAFPLWRDLIATNRELTEYFEILPRHRLTLGWPPQTRRITRFTLPSGPPLDVATVSFSDGTYDATILMDSGRHPGHYLRPAAIVEARALSHAVRHVAMRFKSRPALGAVEISRFLGWAAPASVAPDYRFLLDALARYHGWPSFDFLVEAAGRHDRLDFIDMVAAHTAAVAWVAMAGLDVGQRLLAALVAYPECRGQGLVFSSPWVVAEEIEKFLADAAQRSGEEWYSVEERLGQACESLQSLPRAELPSGVDVHSERMILEIVSNLGDRRGRGHTSLAGFPPDGNPLRVYMDRDDAADMIDLSNTRWALDGVDSWFLARRALLGYTSHDVKHQAWESLEQARCRGA